MGGCFGLARGAVLHAVQRCLKVTMDFRAIHKPAGGDVGIGPREGVDPLLRRRLVRLVRLVIHGGIIDTRVGLRYGGV
jgi:hypothetical protein